MFTTILNPAPTLYVYYDGPVIGSDWFRDSLLGTDERDSLHATEETKLIYAYAGDDFIWSTKSQHGVAAYGGEGNDYFFGSDFDDNNYGGAGNDRFWGSKGSDLFDGGADRDAIDYRTSASRVQVDLISGKGKGGDAEGDTYKSIEIILGSQHNDLLYGDNGDNFINGKDGADLINGRAGNDWIVGGRNDASGVRDILNGGGGNDVFMFYLGDSGAGKAVDIIQDFDMFGSTGDFMRFDVTDIAFAKANWQATDLTLNGKSGAYVSVLDAPIGTPQGVYDVFLENVAAADLTAADFSFV